MIASANQNDELLDGCFHAGVEMTSEPIQMEAVHFDVAIAWVQLDDTL